MLKNEKYAEAKTITAIIEDVAKARCTTNGPDAFEAIKKQMQRKWKEFKETFPVELDVIACEDGKHLKFKDDARLFLELLIDKLYDDMSIISWLQKDVYNEKFPTNVKTHNMISVMKEMKDAMEPHYENRRDAYVAFMCVDEALGFSRALGIARCRNMFNGLIREIQLCTRGRQSAAALNDLWLALRGRYMVVNESQLELNGEFMQIWFELDDWVEDEKLCKEWDKYRTNRKEWWRQ